jgi:small subunit ribosomal protein S1
MNETKNSQPSFDDIMAAVDAPKPPPAPPRPVEKPAPAPKPQASAQPSFEEIMAGAGTQPPPAQGEARPRHDQNERKQSRGAPRKDERKWPVVVRKINLPKPGETLSAVPPSVEGEEAQASGGEETASAEQGASQDGRPPRREHKNNHEDRKPPRQPKAQQPLAESKFAQPGADEEADFAAMFAEAGSGKRQRLGPGARVTGKIAHLGAEVALLDLGGKGEGIIDLRELRDDKGELTAHLGDSIDGYVLSAADGSVVITRSVPKGAGRDVIQAAFAAGLPVEGLVAAVNKGGLEIDLGGVRAFCPTSQIDIRFVDDPTIFVGQKLKFRVMEMRGGNAVLSRRALLEEERKGQAEALRQNLHVGADLEGVITSVRDFGAFVDLGGIEGLVHVSELSHTRVAHAQEAVKPGQKVKVQVLRIEQTKDKDGKSVEKIALSLKALEQDPWDAHRGELHEGQKMQGKVARLQPFGVFVELFPGVDGLVHVSALSDKHVAHPREVVKEGETIWVQIEQIDDASRRVALRKITDEEAAQEGPVAPRERGGQGRGEKSEREPRAAGDAKPQGPRAKAGDVVEATVEKCETFGIFVTWASGALRGMIPNAELGTPRGSDNKKTNPPGSTFKAQILDVDERGRYRLSKTSAEAALDRAEYTEYQAKVKKAAGKGFGTLGDLLRAKLAQKE